MQVVLQLLITGFSLGSFYALIAMGFSIIFGVTHAFNLAHGEMVLLSGYLAYVLCRTADFPFLATLPVCMMALFAVATLLHALLRRLREPFEMNSLLVTFGLALLLQNLMLLFFSADYRLIPLEPAGWFTLPFLQLTITKPQVLLISLSLVATGLMHVVLRKTFLGKALRATIQDREAAALAGIDVQAMNRIGFGLGGLLIGLAGPIFGQFTYLQPAGGMEATITAVVITIFAGVGRTRSILAGGWLLGMAESVAIFAVGASWREAVSALLLLGLLIWKPQGILSHFHAPARSWNPPRR